MVTDASALHLSEVARTFPGGTVALEDVGLTVDRGEFVTVVGPSGCGKSTLLRIISGLDQQTSGSVTVYADKVGYVFQDATLPFPGGPYRGTSNCSQSLMGCLGLSEHGG